MTELHHTTRAAPDQRRDLTARAIHVRAATVDEAQRSVEVILATETPAVVLDSRTWSVIDEVLRVDGADLPAQIPLLADHDRYSIESVRGSIRDLKRVGDTITGRAFFAADDDSLRAWAKVKDGHLTDVSAGYGVREFVDLAPGETRSVGGKAYTAGQRTLRISTKWTPREGSLVPIGADPAAKIREAGELAPSTASVTSVASLSDSTHRSELAAMTKDSAMKFDAWLAARGLALDSLSPAQRTALTADFDAEQTRAAALAPKPAAAPAAPVADSESARAAGIAQERDRVKAIRANGDGVDSAIVERAITDGWDVSRANAEFLAHIRAARQPAAKVEAVQIVADAADKFVRAAETALALRAGVKIIDPKLISEAATLRGAGMQDLARAACSVHGLDAPMAIGDLFKRAISTYSFPTALGNVLNRSIQQGYQDAASTLLQFAQRKEVKDFRQNKNIRMGRFGRPERVGRGGEIIHGTVGEEAENFQALTYGQRFTISREDFINDDLGLFTEVPMRLGSSMKMNIDDVGYKDVLSIATGLGPNMLSDGAALFSAARTDGANYFSGATTALSSASLSAAKQLLRKIKQSGREINITPTFILVPPELEQTAQELVNSTQIIISEAGSSTNATTRGNTNVHFNSLQVLVEPRLSAISATAWYVIASNLMAQSLAVSFLQGQDAPTVERRDPADVLGMGWFAYHDVGIDPIDWRGIVRSKGAA